jgi:GH24 family phage-related lysozyme (muramidase)
VLKATEGGSLKNLKFSNIGGGYNTLSIIGDWVTFDKGYGSGVFELTIYDEKNPNLIYIAIIGKGFKYWLNIKVEESDKFQELVNILTISGKPIDIVNAIQSYKIKKAEKELKIKTDFENEKKEQQALIDRKNAESLQKIKDDELREINNIIKFNATIVDNSFNIGNLVIANKDFPEKMNWEDAKKACEDLGEGWRLPNKNELNTLYQNKDKIGGFANSFYWSSSKRDDGRYGYQFLNFVNGGQFDFNMSEIYNVRAVKNLKLSSNSIIGNAYKIDDIEVAEKDFPEKMNWEDAKKACEKLGEGWRLPTKDELKILFRKKDKIGGLSDCYYWSSSEYGDLKAWAQARSLMQFANGKEFVSCVRAIRTI